MRLNIIHRLLLSFLLVCAFSNVSFSQKENNQGVLTGKIFDTLTSKPIEYVQVKVLNELDSSTINGIYSNVKGEFELGSIPFGKYILKISFLGYETKFYSNILFSNSNPKLDFKNIYLVTENEIGLSEVKVFGKTDVLKTGIDKKIYNVAEDLSSKGGSANDVLNKVPSVGVDQDGKVSLRGDGNVTILIDGRPSSLSGGNGKSLLDAIPASSIERIEIVTNPSAKYSPDGTSGIINVVLKKNKLRGTNGMISASGATGNLFNGSASFSFRNAKLNTYVNYTYRYMEGYRNNYGTLEQISSNNVTTLLDQNRTGSDLNSGHTLRFGTDFYLKPNQTLGFSVTGNDGVRNRTGDLRNNLYSGNSVLTKTWDRLSSDPTSQQNMDFGLSYKIDFKNDKGTLTADVTQSLGTDDIKGIYDEKYYNLDGSQSGKSDLNQRLFNIEKNNVSNAQVDYTRTFPKKNARFEAGLKSIVRNLGVNTNSERLDTLTSVFTPDTLANFVYKYNEQVYGAYGIYGQQKGKFKFQGGLRIEQALQVPYLVSTNQKFTNNYFNIYPSGHIKYNHKENTEWSLSYSRRINRSSSSDMNPFTNYSDPFNLRMGNPNLKPEYINSFDLGYSIEKKKLTLTTSVYYRHTTDVIQRIKIFNADQTSAVTFTNIDQSQSAGIEIVTIYKPVKWWKNVISFNGSGIKYTDNTANFNYNNSGFTWGAKYVGTVDFWKKTMTAQLNINYIAPMVTAQGKAQRRGAVDFSTEKSLKDGKWSIGLRVTDIFNKQGFSFKVVQPSIIQTSEYKWLTRRLYCTISYKFGKLEMTHKKSTNESNSGMDF